MTWLRLTSRDGRTVTLGWDSGDPASDRRRSDRVVGTPVGFIPPHARRQRLPPRSANQRAAPGDTIAARRAPLSAVFALSNIPKNRFPSKKNSYEEKSGKILGGMKSNFNTFHY
jgi:hypothetical protein